YDDQALPLISFNYLGQFDNDNGATASKKNGDWQFSDFTVGNCSDERNRENNIISVSGLVLDGCLQFALSVKWDDVHSQKLVEAFEASLLAIEAYTRNINRCYLTPSDVDFLVNDNILSRLQEKNDIAGLYRANSLQQGFVYHALRQGEVDDAYIVQAQWLYRNEMDGALFKKSWELAQERFESLRLRLNWDDQIIQVIDHHATFEWYEDDYSALSEDQQQNKLRELLELDRQKPYDLSRSGLFRIYFIRLGKAGYCCLFSHHHAILDGWSNAILLDFVHEVYLRLLHGENIKVDIDTSYTSAQRYIQENYEKDRAYWEAHIKQLMSRSDLNGLLKVKARKEGLRLSEYQHVFEPKTGRSSQVLR
ncbi:MAG: condensation domain-containing protein, partial [Thioalkalispiraceae bacterium]